MKDHFFTVAATPADLQSLGGRRPVMASERCNGFRFLCHIRFVVAVDMGGKTRMPPPCGKAVPPMLRRL